MDLEQEVLKLRKQFKTLYDRTYARYTRRSDSEKRHQARMTRWGRTYDKNQYVLKRAAVIVGKRPKGKVAVYLTKVENVKFRKWLKNDFRSKR